MNEKMKLELLLHNLRVCEDQVLAELRRLYPVKCAVEYRLREGVATQIGHVMDHVGGREGRVVVLLAEARNHGARNETSLPAHKIIRKLSDGDSHG